MPKLSDTMSEGVVAEWHKKVGDNVESGDLLADIETDKATMEFESFQDGVLLHIGVETGATAPVNAILAILGEKGEDVEAIIKADAEATPAEEAKEEAPAAPAPAPAPAAAPAPAPAPAKVAAAAPAPAPVAMPSSNGRVKASPLAKRLAQEKGFDLGMIPGSGDAGRIVKRDVENFVPSAAPAAAAGAAPAPVVLPTVVGEETYTEEPVTQMRKAIARRLGESKFSAPHFYLTIDMDMDNAMAARKAMNEVAPVKISFNDMVVKAASMALRQHPAVNSSWREDHIRRNQHVHMGVAVAVDEGLLVPVIQFSDNKSLSHISTETRELAGRARNKKLQPNEMEGSTFTISNLGMFGIEEFTAIINTPNACILAVGAIRQEPVVKDGAVVPGNRMKVTLSCDHRVVDGASGAAFLKTFKELMENPVTMLV